MSVIDQPMQSARTPTSTRLAARAVGLTLLALAAVAWLAILTWAPHPGSPMSVGLGNGDGLPSLGDGSRSFANLAGHGPAAAVAIAMQLLGLAALLLPVAPSAFGVMLFTGLRTDGRSLHPWARLCAWPVSLLASAGVLAALPFVGLPSSGGAPGGIVGQGVFAGLTWLISWLASSYAPPLAAVALLWLGVAALRLSCGLDLMAWPQPASRARVAAWAGWLSAWRRRGGTAPGGVLRASDELHPDARLPSEPELAALAEASREAAGGIGRVGGSADNPIEAVADAHDLPGLAPKLTGDRPPDRTGDLPQDLSQELPEEMSQELSQELPWPGAATDATAFPSPPPPTPQVPSPAPHTATTPAFDGGVTGSMAGGASTPECAPTRDLARLGIAPPPPDAPLDAPPISPPAPTPRSTSPMPEPAGAEAPDTDPDIEAIAGPSGHPPLIMLLDAAPPLQRDPQVARHVLRGEGRILVDALQAFSIDATLRDAHSGPVLTRYVVDLASRVRWQRVAALAGEIGAHAGVEGLRILPGEPPADESSLPDLHRPVAAARAAHILPVRAPETVTVLTLEAPVAAPAKPRLKHLLASRPFKASRSRLLVPLGMASDGEVHVMDLRQHALILAVSDGRNPADDLLRTIVTAVMMRARPADVQLVCVDVRGDRLGVFDGGPHVFAQVSGDARQGLKALNGAVDEIDSRLQVMQGSGALTLPTVNNQIREAAKRGKPLVRRVQVGFDAVTGQPMIEERVLATEVFPEVVIAVAGLEDLLTADAATVTAALEHIGEAGPKAGVHVVAALREADWITRHPSLRDAASLFAVGRMASLRASVGVTGIAGAEHLMSGHDLLAYAPDHPHGLRLQAANVSDAELERVADALAARGA